MRRLLKIELRKIFYNRIFWIALGGYILMMVFVLLMMRHQIESFNDRISESTKGFLPLIPTEIYSFPHVWHNLTFIARFLKIFLGVIMVILVTNEYNYNTLRQNMINGLSRFELLYAKFLDAVLLSSVAVTLIFVFGLISGFVTTDNLLFEDVFSKMSYLAAYFLMLISFLSFVIMLAFLLRKAILVLGLLLLYIFILEPIIAFKYSDSFGDFLPIRSMNLLIEIPDTPIFALFNQKPQYDGISALHIFLSILYATVFLSVSYWYLKKKDL